MKKNRNLYAVILAGGKGTRFWPVSRQSSPKQFLDIAGRGSLLQETLRRIRPRIGGAQTYIVTNALYRREIMRQASRFQVPKANILLEPSGKNTAPAICWAAARIHQGNPHAVMVVLPSDHLIAKRARWNSVLGRAIRLADKDYLVTIGITPTRPETGYGYLQTQKKKIGGKSVVLVKKFKEKPSLAVAKKYIRSRKYYWNSGMFVWKTSAILAAMQAHLPRVYRLIGTKASRHHVRRVWGRLPNISIDYGILEKSKKVAAVPALGLGWSDLGSWESLAEILSKDRQGNTFRGDVLPVRTRNTLVWGVNKLIAPVGLDNIIIIDTPDALLVCRKDRSQSVRDIVTALKNKKRTEI